MATNCCIVGCPTVVSAKNVTHLIPFPVKNTPKYEHWIRFCKESEHHIKRLRKPMICPVHFSDDAFINGKLKPNRFPSQNLSADLVKLLNYELACINHPVAEWVQRTQRNDPNVIITASLLKEKAKEVARILKMHSFDVDLGWLHNFEMHLGLNGLTWKKKPSNLSKDVDVQLGKENVANDCDVELVQLDSEKSIQTYEEALQKAKLLENYVKKAQNKDAVVLVAHMQELLSKALE